MAFKITIPESWVIKDEDSGGEKFDSVEWWKKNSIGTTTKAYMMGMRDAEKEKLPEPKFLEGNCIYKMECENVSETCHLECGRYHKFDLREFIDVAYNLAQPKTEPDSEYDNILIIQSMLNHDHLLIEQHKRDIRKLIEDFLEDLKEIVRAEMKEYGSYCCVIDTYQIKWENKRED